MAIRTRFAIVGSRVIRDATDNRLSVIDILDDMNVPLYPIVMGRLTILWTLSRAPDDPAELPGAIAIRLNDEQLFQTEVAINFQDQQTTRTILAIGGMVIPTPGVLQFVFTQGPTEHTRYEVRLGALPPVAEQPGGPGLAVGTMFV